MPESKSPKIAAAILAAGSGTRFGSDKTLLMLAGKPVLLWSVEAFLNHPRIDQVIVVGGDNLQVVALPEGVKAIRGGETRAQSSRIAVNAAREYDALLIHDAARPFVSAAVIDRVIDAVLSHGAAAPATPITDTIRNRDTKEPLDRSLLVAMQTPQGATLTRFAEASDSDTVTDEMSAIRGDWMLVEGDSANFKITTVSDYERAQAMTYQPLEFRTGLGYDIHRFSDDPNRPLWLGGLHFENGPGLEGHSDADVLIHAAVDAILGAVSLGDIGVHFPPSDPQWKNQPSKTFLAHAARLVADQGYKIVHLDIAVIAETPKIMARSLEMREALAGVLGIEPSRVSIKATTNEKLGAIGRSEGIAAMATATLSGPHPQSP